MPPFGGLSEQHDSFLGGPLYAITFKITHSQFVLCIAITSIG